jgi:hypothetical protein
MVVALQRLPDSLAPLAVPKLRRLLSAQIPSDLADWLDFVALSALVAKRPATKLLKLYSRY